MVPSLWYKTLSKILTTPFYNLSKIRMFWHRQLEGLCITWQKLYKFSKAYEKNFLFFCYETILIKSTMMTYYWYVQNDLVVEFSEWFPGVKDYGGVTPNSKLYLKLPICI